MLKHFKDDTLKYKAACFLIENMQYHKSAEKIISISSQIPDIFHKIDSVLFCVSNGLSINELTSTEARKVFTWKERITKNYLKSTEIEETKKEEGLFLDLEEITAPFLINHIENAFMVKEKSLFAKHLSFDDFCEYILPYRSTSLPFYYNGDDLNKILFHHFQSYPNAHLKSLLKFYNDYVYRMKCLAGKFPTPTKISTFNPFFGVLQDCIGITSSATDIFRACGIPTAIDYNAAYKEYTSRHFHCVVLDTNSNWVFFNPESKILDESDFLNVTNMYRNMYARQKENPFSLKAKGEHIPELFDNPCLKEVTTLYKEVHEVSLPFNFETDNHLAYLYTFLRNSEGFVPASWGIINKEHKQILFSTVITNILYFPVYFDKEEEIFFASPFWVDNESNIHYMDEYLNATQEKGDITLLRKFPRKKMMIEKANKMIGGKFIASNDKDFKNYSVLHEIKEVPLPYLQEVKIQSLKSFQYYRFMALDESNISHLEFIMDEDPFNERIIPATPLPVFKENQKEEKPTYQLINDSLHLFSKKSWFDGNFTTSSGSRKNIDFFLDKPYRIKAIRFSPLNANNGIVKDNMYELRYWDNGWRKAGERETASKEYITFKDVPKGKLYWLKNLTIGREELPFIIEKGEQKFIYHDFIS
ncbi:MAG: hypothetical protein LIO65_06025 [Odoribacter sp.]|nr:hypothetical protein [Odoribacter sp.]